MNNKGIIITIVIALLVLMASVYFVMRSRNTSQGREPVMYDNGGVEVITATPASDQQSGTTSESEIDAELKSLDKDMGNAFEMDSDDDPTLGIN